MSRNLCIATSRRHISGVQRKISWLVAKLVVAVGLVVALSGCTPDWNALIAVHHSGDDGVTLEVYVCDNDVIDKVTLYEHDEPPGEIRSAEERRVWAIEPADDGTYAGQPLSLSLLRTPDGWSEDASQPNYVLDEDRRYSLSVTTERNHYASVQFTLSALQDMDSGLVLPGPPEDGAEPVKYGRFVEKAESLC